MRKRIMTLLMVLASMMVSTTYAQEIYKTVADVPMVQLNYQRKNRKRLKHSRKRFLLLWTRKLQ